MVIKVRASLLFRISCHIRHHLQISRLRNEPLIDEKLRVFGETQVEFPLSFHRVDRIHRLVNFVIQILNFHLAVGGQQKAVHLDFQSIVDFNVDVITCCLLLFRCLAFNGDEVIDDLKLMHFSTVSNKCIKRNFSALDLQSDLEDAKEGLIVVEFPQISSAPLGKFVAKMDRS